MTQELKNLSLGTIAESLLPYAFYQATPDWAWATMAVSRLKEDNYLPEEIKAQFDEEGLEYFKEQSGVLIKDEAGNLYESLDRQWLVNKGVTGSTPEPGLYSIIYFPPITPEEEARQLALSAYINEKHNSEMDLYSDYLSSVAVYSTSEQANPDFD